jgi:hypothetical protein
VTASVLLDHLIRRGVTLEVRGAELVVDGPADALGDSVVEQLRSLKAEMLELLRSAKDSPCWIASDWQAYFDERAGVREYSAKIPRFDAERMAWDDAVTHWLCLNPATRTNVQDGCVHCQGPEEHQNTLLPVLAPEGHTWVHDHCWRSWQALRRRTASNALRVPTRMGGPRAPDDLAEGCATQVALATSDDSRSCLTGQYLHHMAVREPSRVAQDVMFQDRLLDLCGELTGITLEVH